jgi:hypothetical protein
MTIERRASSGRSAGGPWIALAAWTSQARDGSRQRRRAHASSCEWSWAEGNLRLLLPIVGRFMHKEEERNLAAIKEALEGSGASAARPGG